MSSKHCVVLLVCFSLTIPAGPFRAVDLSAAGAQQHQVYMQVAARNDGRAAALLSADLKEKYERVLGERTIFIKKSEVRRADNWFEIGRSSFEKGGSWNDVEMWSYRLLIGPMERIDADLLCERLMGAGLKGCFVRAEE